MKGILSKLLPFKGQEVRVVSGNRASIVTFHERCEARLERLQAKLKRAKERGQPLGEIKAGIKRYEAQKQMLEIALNMDEE